MVYLPRLLALYSLQCQEEEERRLGERISCGKTALETLRLFTCSKEMEAFLESEQAQFWAKAGHPFSPLTAEECRYLTYLPHVCCRRIKIILIIAVNFVLVMVILIMMIMNMIPIIIRITATRQLEPCLASASQAGPTLVDFLLLQTLQAPP